MWQWVIYYFKEGKKGTERSVRLAETIDWEAELRTLSGKGLGPICLSAARTVWLVVFFGAGRALSQHGTWGHQQSTGYLFLLIGLLSPQLTHPANRCCSVAQSCPTLCDPMDCSTPGFLSFTISQSLLTLMSIESVMPSNHLILCRPLLLLPSIFPRIQVFSNESANWH